MDHHHHHHHHHHQQPHHWRRHSLEQVRDFVTGEIRMDLPSVLQKLNECTVEGLNVIALAGALPKFSNANTHSGIQTVVENDRSRWQEGRDIGEVELVWRFLRELERAGRSVELATRGNELVFERLAIDGALGRILEVVLGAFFPLKVRALTKN